MFFVLCSLQLNDAELVGELKEDVEDEVKKFGAVKAMRVPVPKPGVEDTPGLGMVYVQFEDEVAAGKCAVALRGRSFESRVVASRFVQVDDVPAE